jgi:hypothetical protein
MQLRSVEVEAWPCAKPMTRKATISKNTLGDTLRTFANGRKDDWDVWLPHVVFAINNAASTLVAS